MSSSSITNSTYFYNTSIQSSVDWSNIKDNLPVLVLQVQTKINAMIDAEKTAEADKAKAAATFIFNQSSFGTNLQKLVKTIVEKMASIHQQQLQVQTAFFDKNLRVIIRKAMEKDGYPKQNEEADNALIDRIQKVFHKVLIRSTTIERLGYWRYIGEFPAQIMAEKNYTRESREGQTLLALRNAIRPFYGKAIDNDFWCCIHTIYQTAFADRW